MSTSRNNHSKLVETEASRMVPDGFRVKCEQDFDTEDFIVRLTKGRGMWRVRVRLGIYENRDLDWRGWVRRAIFRELKDSRTYAADGTLEGSFVAEPPPAGHADSHVRLHPLRVRGRQTSE